MSNQHSNVRNQLSQDAIDSLKRQMILGDTPPPRVSTRFQKGRSGNPKGRPRKPNVTCAEPTQLHELTLAEAERPIRVREGGNVTEIPTKMALLQAQSNLGLKGNAYAQKHALERIERAQREEAARIAADHEYWRGYRRDALRQLAEARANGAPEPILLPHPDDVVIEPGKPVRIVGPVNDEEAHQYQEIVKLRDALIMQSVFNERCAPQDQKADGEARALGASLLARLVDSALPQRMKIEELDWVMRICRLQSIAKRALLKQTFAAWRAAGMHIPRGEHVPGPEVAAAWIEAGKMRVREKSGGHRQR